MEIKEQNHGFIAPENITEDHYVLGSSPLPQEVLQADGQWLTFIPGLEVQNRNGLETMNCSNYGTLNGIETLQIRKWPNEPKPDYAERFTGVLTGTTHTGNDPHKVAELIRTEIGLIPETDLPFDDTIVEWDEYYSPKPMTEPLLQEGRLWLRKYLFGHEWVYTYGTPVSEKHDKILQALTYSPVAASVYAWAQNDNDLYYKAGPDNHWILIVGYVKDKYWVIFDQYDTCIKKLVWEFDFGFAKRYSLERIATPPISQYLPPSPLPTTEGKNPVVLIGEFIKWFLNEIFK